MDEHPTDTPDTDERSSVLGMGALIGVGAGLGLIFGTFLGNLGLGLAFGAGLGTVAGAVVESQRKKHSDGSS